MSNHVKLIDASMRLGKFFVLISAAATPSIPMIRDVTTGSSSGGAVTTGECVNSVRIPAISSSAMSIRKIFGRFGADEICSCCTTACLHQEHHHDLHHAHAQRGQQRSRRIAWPIQIRTAHAAAPKADAAASASKKTAAPSAQKTKPPAALQARPPSRPKTTSPHRPSPTPAMQSAKARPGSAQTPRSAHSSSAAASNHVQPGAQTPRCSPPAAHPPAHRQTAASAAKGCLPCPFSSAEPHPAPAPPAPPACAAAPATHGSRHPPPASSSTSSTERRRIKSAAPRGYPAAEEA